jgi:hypothetical protein
MTSPLRNRRLTLSEYGIPVFVNAALRVADDVYITAGKNAGVAVLADDFLWA